MLSIFIKGDSRRKHEDYVARTYHIQPHEKDKMEMVECVAARTRETLSELKRLESQKTVIFNNNSNKN